MITPTHIRIAAKALVASAVAHDLVTNLRIIRTCREVAGSNDVLHQTNEILLESNATLIDELERADRRASYLIKKLTEANVPCDEYDLIVLNNLI